MQNMQASDTTQIGKTTSVVIRVSDALAQEFYRCARVERRSGTAQGEVLIREFVAATQAKEAADAAEGRAAA